MAITQLFIEKLLKGNGIEITAKNKAVFEAYILEQQTILAVEIIAKNQKELMENWKIKEYCYTILTAALQIPNGNMGKTYFHQFDCNALNFDAMAYHELVGLEAFGLQYNKQEKTISGIPSQNGDFKIHLKFRVIGENENSELHQKPINFIINADPKSLWTDKPSNHADPYWKTDAAATFNTLGTKNSVVASKRGRAHANVGSFRDDDFALHHFQKNNWSVVAVADGAGSAVFSRKGSEIACNEVVNYFDFQFTDEVLTSFDTLIESYNSEIDNKSDAVKSKKQLQEFITIHLGGCAKYVHQKLQEFATSKQCLLSDLHTTLIFTLFKKYDFGYVVLSFGVGDCPIGIVSKNQTEVQLLNWLDVGEYGGGTRFITMPEIFTSDKFESRINFTICSDFDYLFLMTDGIYDAKFGVEANLQKIEKWNAFIADLKGANEDKHAVIFEEGNTQIAQQLNSWLDFWSPGNHDDRTLAVVF